MHLHAIASYVYTDIALKRLSTIIKDQVKQVAITVDLCLPHVNKTWFS